MPRRSGLLLGAAALAATTGSAAAAHGNGDKCIDTIWLWLLPLITLFVIGIWCLIVNHILEKRKGSPGKVFPVDEAPAKPAPGRPVPTAVIPQQQQQRRPPPPPQQEAQVLPVQQQLARQQGIKAINNQNDWTALFNTCGSKLVVVHFSATWCEPCKAIAPRFLALATEHPHCIFAEVDVEHNKVVSTKCGVTSMPTFQFFLNSTKVDELVGAKYDDLVSKLITAKATI